MPRKIADAFCRIRQTPFYGSGHAVSGYRTYCHTPRQYEAMLREAGFATVDVQGCHPGYNMQHVVYPMKPYGPRRQVRQIVNSPRSRLGQLQRVFTESPLLYEVLEEEVLLLAGKEPREGPVAWRSFVSDPSETVVQFSNWHKLFLLCFQGDRPRVIAKAGRDESARRSLEVESAFLERIGTTTVAQSPLSWHRPLGKRECNGLTFFLYEYADGKVLDWFVRPRSFSPRQFIEHLGRLADGYVDLFYRLSTALRPEPGDLSQRLGDFADLLGSVDIGDGVIGERIKSACERLREGRWGVSCVHGDLSVNNAIAVEGVGLVLIDWENASDTGLVSIDLVRLLHSGTQTKMPGRALQAQVRSAARDQVERAIGRSGVKPSDLGDIKALYAAHQCYTKPACARDDLFLTLRDDSFLAGAVD